MKLNVRPEWTLRRQLYHRTVERDDATLRERCSHNRGEQRQAEARRKVFSRLFYLGVFWRRRPANEEDRNERESDAGKRQRPQPFADRKSEQDRDHGGDDGSCWRDDCHRADSESAIQKGDANAAAEAGHESPGPIARRDSCRRQKWKDQQKQNKPGELRPDDRGDRVRAARR